MAAKEEVVPKEGVEEKLSDLKIDAAPVDAPAEKAVETPAETPAAEETKEEPKEESVERLPTEPEPRDPKVLEVVKTVDTQTVAPDSTEDTPTHETPTQVVHVNAD
ncbi:hypothetical protein R1sor_013153 [Riccia sorocarpa]|uniref:Uncharacterized protein n=1 Tax=Riccia sorocarpa TaxID=122646 RepID=A0ABD3H9N0_9MARC